MIAEAPDLRVSTCRLVRDIARLRSFSLAAERHGVTQSAASQIVRKIERELGAQLFDRRRRPLLVTAPGAAFVDGCAKILDAHEWLLRTVAR